ncbi:MAG: hypothetical protein U9O94_01080 [Nanoarchaeota archaeon]|nr:hypothetical protein [Nanoarchaeota archaeon]
MALKVSKLKKTILGIAIAILLAFFWGHATITVYEEPELEDFCKDIKRDITVESCDDYEYEPIESREYIRPMPVGKEGYCHCYEMDKEGTLGCSALNPKYDECSEQYREVEEKHERHSFMILVVLGLISILVGGVFLKREAVGSGIMGGGVLTIIYASMRYWDSIQDYGRLLILGIAIVVLVWVGYKKLKD